MSAGSTSSRSRMRSRGGICFERDDADSRRRVTIREDVDPSASDHITSREPDGRTFDDELPRGPIPGTGELGDDCGEDVPLFCKSADCGDVSWVGSTCRRSRCPRCWQSWAFHRAKKWCGKFEGLRSERPKTAKGGPFFHHVTVSMAEIGLRFDSDDALNRGFDVVKVLLQKVFVDTGLIVYHPWRIAEEHRGEVMGHDSGDGDLTWNDVLELAESEGRDWKELADEYLVYAPHFHAIVLADMVSGAVTEAVEAETGIVIHRITPGDSNVSIYGIEELAKVTAYCLSHAGLMESGSGHRVAMRGFGELHNYGAPMWAEQKAVEALRDVSYQVLGVDFQRPTCDAPAPENDAHEGGDECGCDHPHPDPRRTGPSPAPLAAPSRSGSPSSSAAVASTPSVAVDGGDPEGRSPSPEGSGGCCGAPLLPIWKAPDYLEDDDWIESIGASAEEQLRDAYEDWTSKGKPRPEDVPDPETIDADPPG